MARRRQPITRLDFETDALEALCKAKEALLSINLRTARGYAPIRLAVQEARLATNQAIDMVNEAMEQETVYSAEQSIQVVR